MSKCLRGIAVVANVTFTVCVWENFAKVLDVSTVTCDLKGASETVQGGIVWLRLTPSTFSWQLFPGLTCGEGFYVFNSALKNEAFERCRVLIIEQAATPFCSFAKRT